MIVPALIIYAFPLSSIEPNANLMLGTLYSGNSMMKNDFLYFIPVTALTSKAPKRIKSIPTKYISGPTHGASEKNAPANNAITGSLAPHGINVASIADVLLSRSLRIVLHDMIAGIPQPVPITIGITVFPERPTLLKIGSSTTVARDIYPQSSSKAIRKYITITSGRNPTTAPTPPMIPSTSKA